jgi:intracellular multiplication protein IcmE
MWIVSVSSKPSEESKSQMARITSRQDISTGENKAYTKQIETFNSRKAEEATKSGSSWISIPAYYDIKLIRQPSKEPVLRLSKPCSKSQKPLR